MFWQKKLCLKKKNNVTLTLILQHVLEVCYYLVNRLINNSTVIHMSMNFKLTSANIHETSSWALELNQCCHNRELLHYSFIYYLYPPLYFLKMCRDCRQSSVRDVTVALPISCLKPSQQPARCVSAGFEGGWRGEGARRLHGQRPGASAGK